MGRKGSVFLGSDKKHTGLKLDGQPEVGELDGRRIGFVDKEDILGLEIPVHDTEAVAELHGLEQALH